jgi:hypothetical protein
VKLTFPRAEHDHVQTNVWAAPGGMVTDPAGRGPLTSETKDDPVETPTTPPTAFALSPPTFVTVNLTSTHLPTPPWAGATARDEINCALGRTASVAPTGGAQRVSPLKASTPDRVTVYPTLPTPARDTVQTSVWDSPAASVIAPPG